MVDASGVAKFNLDAAAACARACPAGCALAHRVCTPLMHRFVATFSHVHRPFQRKTIGQLPFAGSMAGKCVNRRFQTPRCVFSLP